MNIFFNRVLLSTIVFSRLLLFGGQPFGRIIGWGDNVSGAVTGAPAYTGTNDEEFFPMNSHSSGAVAVAGVVLTNITAISAGDSFGLALKTDGTVVGWGLNYEGRAIGMETLNSDHASGQVIIGGRVVSNIVSIAAGNNFSLGLKSDGTVCAWGVQPQTGAFSSPSTPTPSNEPPIPNRIDPATGTNLPDETYLERRPTPPAPQVGAQVGNGLRIGVQRDGTVMTKAEDQKPIPLTNVVAIAARESDGLALKADGTVVGWRSGALRLTDTQMYAVAGISNVVAIAVGGGHGGGISLVSVGLLKDGTVITWGAKTLHNDFAPPAGLSNVVAIAAGAVHCLALKSDGTVMAWGDNEEGQVAGVPSNRQSPDAQGLVRINGQVLTNVVAISACYDYSLALKRDGTVVGWGANCPGIPAGLNHVIAISAGDGFCLAITNATSPNFGN